MIKKRRGGVIQTTEVPDFYHPTDELETRLKSHIDNCAAKATDASYEEKEFVNCYKQKEGDNCVKVPVIKFEPKSPSGDVTKHFLLFGEHSRELISPEVCLKLVEKLCSGNLGDDFFQHNSIFIVPNANPVGRERVLNGEFCHRTNGRGVDLNRNWDVEWELLDTSSSTYGGTEPFSEDETKHLKVWLEAFRPHNFITIHSGSGPSILSPWAYTKSRPLEADADHTADDVSHEDAILRLVGEHFCKDQKCDFGQAAKTVDYLCPGTCVDYAYTHMSKYSFAIEVGVDWSYPPALLESNSLHEKNRRNKAKARRKMLRGKSCSFIREEDEQAKTSMLQTLENEHGEMQIDCFSYFNPPARKDYDIVIDSWSEALIFMIRSVHNDMTQNAGSESKFIPPEYAAATTAKANGFAGI